MTVRDDQTSRLRLGAEVLPRFGEHLRMCRRSGAAEVNALVVDSVFRKRPLYGPDIPFYPATQTA
jgi:hypothetical protein